MKETDKVKGKPGKFSIDKMMSGIGSMLPKDKFSQASVLLGITAITSFSVLTRESLNIFGGNEFMTGAQLFAWILMLGAGAWLGTRPASRFIKSDPMAWGFIFMAIFPVLSLLILHYGQILFFGNSATPGFWLMTLFSMLVQAPVMVLIGVMFTHFMGVISADGNKDAILKGLIWKGVGSFVGGLIFVFLLPFFLKNAQVLLVLSLVNLAFGWTLVFGLKKIFPNILALVLNVCFLSLLIAFNFQGILTGSHLESPLNIRQQETNYGQLTVIEEGGRMNFYTGTSSYIPARDSNSIQESVHYTLLQHYNPQSILLVSGAASGYAEEVMKFHPKQFDILELNPSIFEEKFSFTKPISGVSYIREDPANYLLHCKSKYDAILLVLPNPSTIQINRYYTLEFFKELKTKLNDDAYVYVNLDKTKDMTEAQMNELNSIVFYTLKKVFRHTLFIPGAANHFIASERQLSIRLAAKAVDKSIETKVIAGDPVSDSLLRMKVESAMKNLTTTIKLNRDYHPGAFFTVIRAGMPSMNMLTLIITILLTLLVALYLFKGKARKTSVFVTAFTMLSITVLLLMSFQAMFGNLYLMTGILLCLFFLGISIGIKIFLNLESNESAPSAPSIQVAAGSYALLILFFLLGIREVTNSAPVIYGLFFLLMLGGGAITGMQFTAAMHKEPLEEPDKKNGLYLALLLGASFGALIATILFFPVVGLILMCIVLGVLNAGMGFLFY